MIYKRDLATRLVDLEMDVYVLNEALDKLEKRVKKLEPKKERKVKKSEVKK